MYIPKQLRKQVYWKYCGLCAYSGYPLESDWQVDHLEPVKFFEMGMSGDPNDLSNLMPTQRILNHYKRGLPIEKFKGWLLGGLHKRLSKLPKNPKKPHTIRHKEYLLEVASLMGITQNKPFCGVLYYESIICSL